MIEPVPAFDRSSSAAAPPAPASVSSPARETADAARPGGDRTQALRARIVARFTERGFARVEPAILQPAAPFLALSGEDIRARMLRVSAATGEEGAAPQAPDAISGPGADGAAGELCLRPEYTLPVAALHAREGAPSRRGAYAYGGPVFRLRAAGLGEGLGLPGGEAVEFTQAGFESFGRLDRDAADAEAIALALEALALAGVPRPAVLLGDVAVFSAFLAALRLPDRAARRLRRAYARGALASSAPEPFVARLPAGEARDAGPGRQGLLADLRGRDPQAARALLEDLLGGAGAASVAGRDAAEIAARLMEGAARSAVLPDPGAPDADAFLARFRAIAGDPDEACLKLRELCRDLPAEDALPRAVDALEARLGFLAARGVDPGTLRFEAGFGRPLDYYSGFVLEARARPGGPVLAGGGRYDGVMRAFGVAEDVPAVGVSFWVDRLAALAGENDAMKASGDAA